MIAIFSKFDMAGGAVCWSSINGGSMKLPEGITFTPIKLRTDDLGNKHLDGILSCTPEFIERKICEIKTRRNMAYEKQSLINHK